MWVPLLLSSCTQKSTKIPHAVPCLVVGRYRWSHRAQHERVKKIVSVFWFLYCNSFSATRLALAVLAKLSQSELWSHVWSRSRSWSHSLRESVTQSVSWAQSSLPCPSIRLSPQPVSQSICMASAWRTHVHMRSAAHNAAACKIVMLDLSADWTRDSGTDSLTEREINDSHTAKTAITIFIRLVVDVRGQFVMPTKCYKFAALNLN